MQNEPVETIAASLEKWMNKLGYAATRKQSKWDYVKSRGKNYAHTSTSKNLAKTEENKEIQSSKLNHQQLFRSLREANLLALKNFTESTTR